MEVKPENIIVNSCEYTPVYLIQSPNLTQTGSYILAPASQDSPKPITNNLKSFYENSGNIENSVLSNPKPRVLKKQTPGVVGNNLKLASFLLPKSEPVCIKKEYVAPVNNVVLKPVVSTVSSVVTPIQTTPMQTVQSAVPRVEVERKIVRVGTIPLQTRTTTSHGRLLPKIKPKVEAPIIQQNPTKHTSVQLLKLGETYHSLNQLSDEQMKIVNKALKIFSNDPEKIPKEPAYDPITNTKFIYKIVSPRDLTVVGKNKIEIKKKCEIRKQIKRVRKEENEEQEKAQQEAQTPATPPSEPTITRSGRKVKLPKQLVLQDSDETARPRKKTSGSIVNCSQCSAEFCSLYRLQRHYDANPTHMPAKIHSNLFHCLVAIIKGGSPASQPDIFTQQLENLVDTLRALLPCLLKQLDDVDGQFCCINEDVGRLLGMKPGMYNINIDAFDCIKDKDGHCIHDPPPKTKPVEVNEVPEIWQSEHNEEISHIETETEDCARVHAVDKWPGVTKRSWKVKQDKQSTKKMRLASENNEQYIELGTEDVFAFSNAVQENAINEAEKEVESIKTECADQPVEDTSASVVNQSEKSTHVKFHSTHFDIRSSPIKPSALVRKFQINPKKLTNYDVQIMQPLEKPSDTTNDVVMESDSDNLELFKDNEITKETDINSINSDLNFGNSKDWSLSSTDVQPLNLFDTTLTPIKSNSAIEPSLIHMKDQSDNLFDSSPKTNLMDSSVMILHDKSNGAFEPSKSVSLLPTAMIQAKSDHLIDHLHFEDKPNSLFEPCTTIDQTFIQTKLNGFVPSLLHVKDKSNSLFEQSSIPVKQDSSTIESDFLHTKDKSNGLFEALARVKERSHSLFESSTRKNKNVLLGPSLISAKDKTAFYEILSHTSEMEPLKADSDFIQPSDLMHVHKTQVNIDISQSDLNCSNSNQGHSVLNFLESLGSDCLVYPETDIRNNSVDFQDLFSFNS